MNPSGIELPAHLYDPGNVAIGGTVRASGYLMRKRIEHLLEQPKGSLGLRRAMHACILAEVVNNAFMGPHNGPRAERMFGLFARDLTREVINRLVASKATLRPDEKQFADIDWWGRLDKERASLQLENNLLRMIGDEPTICLTLGIELQVLLDIHMRLKFTSEYQSLIAKYATPKYPVLVAVRDRFSQMLDLPAAA